MCKRAIDASCFSSGITLNTILSVGKRNCVVNLQSLNVVYNEVVAMLMRQKNVCPKCGSSVNSVMSFKQESTIVISTSLVQIICEQGLHDMRTQEAQLQIGSTLIVHQDGKRVHSDELERLDPFALH